MTEYAYGFYLERQDGDVFFRFPRFPEIISAVGQEEFAGLDEVAVAAHAHDAAIAALQAYVAEREPLPEVDDPRHLKADGFVRLSALEAMKLELYRVYRANCRSVADLARQLCKSETAARRLLDLRHRSWTREVEAAIEHFGKQLVHRWHIEAAPRISHRRYAAG